MAREVVIQVRGMEVVVEYLEASAVKAGNMHPIWPSIIRRMEQIESEQFATEGARSGNPWAPLSENYMWGKFKAGLSLDIMRATEALEEALTGPGEGATRYETDDTLVFGADLPQFAYHQDRPSDAPYPERLPIDLTARDALQFSEMILGYVAGTVNRAGLRITPGTGRFAPGGSVFS